MNVPARARENLRLLARRRGTITYWGLALALDLEPPNTIRRVAEALEALMREDQKNGAPLIAALVVSKFRTGVPAPIFFDLARKLGLYRGSEAGPEAAAWHAEELERAWG